MKGLESAFTSGGEIVPNTSDQDLFMAAGVDPFYDAELRPQAAPSQVGADIDYVVVYPKEWGQAPLGHIFSKEAK